MTLGIARRCLDALSLVRLWTDRRVDLRNALFAFRCRSRVALTVSGEFVFIRPVDARMYFGLPERRLVLAAYLAGSERRQLPRQIRRAFVRSEVHRAWLAGWHGYYWRNSIRHGLNNPRSLSGEGE